MVAINQFTKPTKVIYVAGMPIPMKESKEDKLHIKIETKLPESSFSTKKLSIAEMAAKGRAMKDRPGTHTKTSMTPTMAPDLNRACEFFGFGGVLEWITLDVLNLIYIDLLQIYATECGGTQEEYDKLREYKRTLDTIAR